MEKIRSSKKLKESMQNIEKVVNFTNDNVDVHADIDLITADALDQDIESQAHVEDILTELDKKNDKLTLEEPEAPEAVDNMYTKKLKLDEELEDFSITSLKEDGRKAKQAVRGEDEGDVYLDYSMHDFVSGLITDKNCNTNPTPITPVVWRRDPKDNVFKYMPMKKFMSQGEDVYVDDESSEQRYKGPGAPQIGADEDNFIVSCNELEDLQQLQQGLAFYGIRYTNPEEKRSRYSHWRYSMKVFTPLSDNGEILSLAEWLALNNRKIEDVMRPEFVSRYEKRKPLRDKMQFLETIYDKYSDIAANDSSLTLKDIVDKIKEEATSQNLILSASDIKYIKDRFKEEYPDDETLEYTYDKYITKGYQNNKIPAGALYKEMVRELRNNFVVFDAEALKSRFMAELKDTFEDQE